MLDPPLQSELFFKLSHSSAAINTYFCHQKSSFYRMGHQAGIWSRFVTCLQS